MTKKYKPKIAANKSLVLESCIGFFSDLITVETSKKKEKTKEKIRCNLSGWMGNPHFLELRDKLFDVALVIFVDDFRIKLQDVDNIAKTVLDSLKMSKKDINRPFLFYNDSQVVRLLIYKLRKKDVDGFETDNLIVSFREHNPQRQMILI